MTAHWSGAVPQTRLSLTTGDISSAVMELEMVVELDLVFIVSVFSCLRIIATVLLFFFLADVLSCHVIQSEIHHIFMLFRLVSVWLINVFTSTHILSCTIH